MLAGLVRSVSRPGCATRSDLSVAAYCLAFGASPDQPGDDDAEESAAR